MIQQTFDFNYIACNLVIQMQGRIQGGGVPGARPPLKLEKIRFFGVKL
jgi:hypothetical protein